MEIVALIGPSGSGKSHRALAVARDYAAEAIIDDGLLIQGSRILAGISAKEQPTRVGAIRTALFSDPDHAREVRERLAAIAPRRLLVISTSREMAARITSRLQLPMPSIWVDISEVATPKEIARARQIRDQLGKHVIPAPTVEVKPRFNGTFIEPLKTFLRRRQAPPGKKKNLWVEQTTVRPTFNSLGHFYIAHSAVAQLASYMVTSAGLANPRVQVENNNGNLVLNLEVAAPYGVSWPPLLKKAQKRVKSTITSMTALEVEAVNITVRGIIFSDNGH
ncbi:Asp23/Gls24 family envelope stress response protein [Moorella sulfitireducens]|uniref:Asp23/Gls24 family envelope stress response protein n=1 Tax=Neomoorella sulfitireducens TaxID=2972948 RepID=UPI0021AD4470|nr:Asp23/Gls24 family envelope stress response protein [Moorella sulfitireducens]